MGFQTKVDDQTPTYGSQLMSAPFASTTDRILLVELIEYRTAILLMMWSSLGMVFHGRSDRLTSE